MDRVRVQGAQERESCRMPRAQEQLPSVIASHSRLLIECRPEVRLGSRHRPRRQRPFIYPFIYY